MWYWPSTLSDLESLQGRLAEEAAAQLSTNPWSPGAAMRAGGCFVAYARGEAGPGHPGDRAWAAAVIWAPAPHADPRRGWGRRTPESVLRRVSAEGTPRQATDVEMQAVVADRVPAGYSPGFLALREGPILAQAVSRLAPAPDVLLVDATGLDHPRGAGLAVHLGAVVGLPTIGVTHRPLVAAGETPQLTRGQMAPLLLAGREVGHWVCTRSGARPVVAHAGWRTDPLTAARVVLLTSTPAARTPVPLQEARRVAREARSMAGAG